MNACKYGAGIVHRACAQRRTSQHARHDAVIHTIRVASEVQPVPSR